MDKGLIKLCLDTFEKDAHELDITLQEYLILLLVLHFGG